MLRACVIDFRGSWDDLLPLIEFSYHNNYNSCIGMARFEALYGRSCTYPVGWFKVGESSILGPKVIHEALEKVIVIRDRKRPLEFDVGDQVYLKISPMKGVMRFGRKGKLSPRYVGLYEILKRVGEVEYELAFPAELASVHPLFHISMLKKCLGDPASILPVKGLGVDEDLSYEEVHVEIFDR
ncbi:uncharacterized protein [Solanum lycopersicum]|uniref:uncharacterized protein n=1 Tax=Solanum lycopersicum TaxID=4081 RepID=UPI003747EE5F